MTTSDNWYEESLEKLKGDGDIFSSGGWVNPQKPTFVKRTPEEVEFEKTVKGVVDDIAQMLIHKNRSYGDSALNPVRVFSQADSTEQIKVRIDDKLSRIQNSDVDSFGEDTIQDLIGYLVLLKISLEDDNE